MDKKPAAKIPVAPVRPGQPAARLQPNRPGQVNCYDEEDSGPRHFDAVTNVLEIVQAARSDKVLLHYKGSTPPSELGVIRDGKVLEPIRGQKRASGVLYELDVKYEPVKDPYRSTVGNVLLWCFRPAAPPSSYEVGNLPRPLTIKAYNPDQWKLSVSFPPVRKQTLGARYTSSHNETVVKKGVVTAKSSTRKASLDVTSESSSWRASTSREMAAEYESRTTNIKGGNLYVCSEESTVLLNTKAQRNTPNLDKPIVLQRNGVEATFDLLDVVAGAVSLFLSFQKMKAAFGRFAPKIGWYFDLEAKLFEGKLELYWGWKESADHRAYFNVGIGAEIVLLEVKLEVGFALGVAKIEFQVCVEFKGGLSLKAAVERAGPGTQALALGTVSGTIEAGGYLRAKVGDVVQFSGGVKSSITCESKVTIDLKQGVKLAGENKWDGLAIVVEVKTFFGWETSEKVEVAGPQTLGTWQFPGGDPPPSDELKTELEVSRAIVPVLTKGWGLTVRKKSSQTKRSFFTGQAYVDIDWDDVASDDVADMIADLIWKERRAIRVDAKTVEAIALSVRKACDRLATREWECDWLDLPDLEMFLGSPQMKAILREARDPAKMMMDDLRKKAAHA